MATLGVVGIGAVGIGVVGMAEWPGADVGAAGTVVVPVHGPPRGGEMVCELRLLVDDRLALPVYPTVDDLVAGCGGGQPWMEVLAERVPDLVHAAGADVVVTGLELPEEWRHPTGPGRGAS